MDLVEIRRLKALEIMHENALDEESFAMCLGKDGAQLKAMLSEGSSKKISDPLARLMEQTFSKPNLWMDQAQGQDQQAGPSYDLFG